MPLRADHLDRMRSEAFDVLIVGGGINGAVAAAALSAHGVKTALIDKGDFASGTSSQTSNLAWGGIKYLETFEIGLVRNLCKSRNRLMKAYPTAVREVRFLTSVPRRFRFPAIFVYFGAVFYWALGGFQTKAPHFLRRKNLVKVEPVIDHSKISGAFEYSDAYFPDNDARFVFNFIRASWARGAAAVNYVEGTRSNHDGEHWQTKVLDRISGEESVVESRVLINACGPWVDQVNVLAQQMTEYRHILSKGIHVVVDRVTPNERILTFFASDGRPFFIVPMGTKTCIGTTDTPTEDTDPEVNEEDRQFVLDNANEFLQLENPLTVNDIIAERCGVRPLAVNSQSNTTDWIQLSRKHAIEISSDKRHISIFGGKFTDCLNIGEEIVDVVANMGIGITAHQGQWFGEPSIDERESYFDRAFKSSLDDFTADDATEPLSERLWRRYGIDAAILLTRIGNDPAQAERVFPNCDLLWCEVSFAMEHEMVATLEDFLRRRTNIDLTIGRKALENVPVLQKMAAVLFDNNAENQLRQYYRATGEADDHSCYLTGYN